MPIIDRDSVNIIRLNGILLFTIIADINLLTIDEKKSAIKKSVIGQLNLGKRFFIIVEQIDGWLDEKFK